MRSSLLVLLGAGLFGCATGPRDGPSGVLLLESLRVMPPKPGECVGRVEATAVNGTSEPLHLGSLRVLQDGKWMGDQEGVFPLGSEEPGFAMVGPLDSGSCKLLPGASCVVATGIVRVHGGSGRRVSFQGQVHAVRGPEEAAITKSTSPVDFDPSAWPVAEAMGPDALDRALAGGHAVTVKIESFAMPGGGMFSLDIGPGGRAWGVGFGRLPGRGNGRVPFKASGTLTRDQQESLISILRASPFAAFRGDPKWLGMYDGHPVHLIVVAGPAAFFGSSQEEDFRKAGLVPLLEHLRLLLRDLPDAEEAR